jgi:hypothetical protein
MYGGESVSIDGAHSTEAEGRASYNSRTELGANNEDKDKSGK